MTDLEKGNFILRDKFICCEPKLKIPAETVELWWPLGLGQQNLYLFSIENQASRIVGFRTVEFNSLNFQVKVNGKNIWLRGANWIEHRHSSPKMLEIFAEKKFNTLRVWGGGEFGSDEFYEKERKYSLWEIQGNGAGNFRTRL